MGRISVEEFSNQMDLTVVEVQHLNDVAGENELEEAELKRRCEEVEQFILQEAAKCLH